MKRLFISLLLLLISFNAFGNVIKVEGEQTYIALTPSVLTAYKALSFLPGDVLSQSSGSAIGSSLTVNESLDSNQGTICFWYYPYNLGSAGQLRYLYDCYVDTNNRISVYISAANNLTLDVIGAGTTSTCSTSFAAIKPFTWNHIIATWSKNTDVNGTNNSYIYLNGSGAGQTSATTAMSSVPSTFSIGSDYSGKNSANGLLAYKIMRQYMTSDQVTADYNSGNGSTEFFTRTPHCICLGLTSDSSTGISYVHRGKVVSAIADGATEDTVTTVAGSDTSFADNDRVIISAGNGYNSNLIGNTFVDGAPSSTSVNVDDGAGADVGAIEKIGVFVNASVAGRYAEAANSVINDITNQDFSMSFWINKTTATSYSMGKHVSPYGYYVVLTNTNIRLVLKDGAIPTTFYIQNSGSISFAIGTWHHVAFVIDRDTLANCLCYLDGYALPTTSSGTLANIVTMTNTGKYSIGYVNGWDYSYAKFSDAKIAIGTVWSPTEILYQATHPNDVSASAGTITDNWLCNDGSGTTVTGAVNNLTLSSALAWNQSAFLSRNLYIDGDQRHGGIGALSRISGATATKNTTTPNADEQDLKIVNTGAAQGYAGQNIKTAANEDYYFYGLVKGPTTVNGASQLVNIDATSALGITATQAGLTAATVTETEFCFQAADTDTTVDLGTGSVTNAETTYWDNVKVLANLVVNGGCEGGANPPASWTQEANATVISDTSPHAGTNCLKVTAGADNVGAKQSITLVSGKYYTIIAYCKATAGDTARVIIDKGDGTLLTVGSVTATTWTRVRISFTATGTSGVVYLRGVTNTDVVWFDDIALLRDDSASATTATKVGIVPVNQPMLIR